MPDTRPARLAAIYERHRRELVGFLTRLVIQSSVAEEIAQEAAARLVQQVHITEADDAVRGWLFRVATNLGLDHLRRHSTRHEFPLIQVRGRAEADAEFVAASAGMRGSPETAAIAREHLVACFVCTLRTLPARHAAALLLKEVYEFSNQEVADVMGVRFGQAKTWIQSARRRMTELYSTTCALVAKQGVCYQCVELDRFFNGAARDPLHGSSRTLDARLQILRDLRAQPLGPWHARLFELVRDVVG